MRIAAILIAALFAFVVQPPRAHAAPSRTIDFASREAVLGWINGYRRKGELARVPAAYQALSRAGALRDAEAAAVYVGFLAGVLGANGDRAADIVEKLLVLEPEDHWIIVRAIAYSGLPNWQALMTKFAGRMPLRRVMAERYVAGTLPRLDQIVIEGDPTVMQKMRGAWRQVRYFGHPPHEGPPVLVPTGEIIDTLWGYYFATGAYAPVGRLVAMLAYAKDQDSVEKLTVANMAKYTLASNAVHDTVLLGSLKWAVRTQPKDIQLVLMEAIDAAETVDVSKLRKAALASIEDLRRKGPASRRNMSLAGQIGQGALGLGCIAAAATGHVELGIPCVVGGALSSGVMNYINTAP